MRHLLLLTGLPIPYTINLLCFGLGLGLVLQYYVVRPLTLAADGDCDGALRYLWQDNVFIRSLTTLAALDPHLLLHIFLPPLIFESASAIEWHVFFQLKWAALLLAVSEGGLFNPVRVLTAAAAAAAAARVLIGSAAAAARTRLR